VRGHAAPLARPALEQLLRLALADITDTTTAGLPCRARAYASAGGMHELDIYLVAADIDGLAPGLHRFCVASGQLVQQPAPAAPLQALLAEAQQCWGAEHGRPRALIVLCADLPLMTWRYEAIAYRLSLLNAGHASQLLLQLGSALGIGLCPLGNGDAAAFAQAAGLDEWALPALAEIAVAGSTLPGANAAKLHPPALKESP
jgi:SagB-type dehydrogenase family enzyme